METINQWLLGLVKTLHLPMLIGGHLSILSKGDQEFKYEHVESSYMGDNIPHFIFSDKR